MQAQRRELKKNYIGILSDGSEDQRTAEPQPKSGRPVKDYVRGLIAAVLNRDGERRSYSLRRPQPPARDFQG